MNAPIHSTQETRLERHSMTWNAAIFFRWRDRAGLAARAYLVAGFGSWLAGSDSPRKGSLSLREISGQNSRSTSKPMS